MTKPIKILFTIPNFDTAGSGKVVYDLVKGVDRNLFEPHIACHHDRGAFFNEVKGLGVPIHIVEFSTTYRPFSTFPLRLLKIIRFFKREQFDLIHSWHWSSDISEPLAAKWAGIPFIYTKKAMGWGNRAWRWRSQLSTQIITINRDMEKGILAPYKDKLRYMPLGVDLQRFQPLARTRSTPLGHRYQEDDFVIVSIANLAPVKGIEVLLEAVRMLEDTQIQVLIVGDHHNAYGRALKETYSSTQVHFIPKQLDIRPYLAVADLFVIPTKDEGRKEGLPIAPMEAMACGKIVVGSDISGIKDILNKYPQCLFEPNNIENLKKILEKIKLMEHDEKIQLGKRMSEFIKENFSVNQFIKSHESLYVSLYNCYHN
ncbi:glycosyltransferase [Mangrovimonas sp. AS39]|uniref:glycosyltransferase n=1 Tax=Mangrovimonas futianensis TaxID=2895523 RepID=UPI001E3FF626|nr:glycosyltransferase [Mangrovimonas futianensis]MCF1191226.1 glycosyltransferase [Mangrovimonas futianensis]MCF1194921.1 glycosyltransferase [Mangrovimonas futianensis]